MGINWQVLGNTFNTLPANSHTLKVGKFPFFIYLSHSFSLFMMGIKVTGPEYCGVYKQFFLCCWHGPERRYNQKYFSPLHVFLHALHENIMLVHVTFQTVGMGILSQYTQLYMHYHQVLKWQQLIKLLEENPKGWERTAVKVVESK